LNLGCSGSAVNASYLGGATLGQRRSRAAGVFRLRATNTCVVLNGTTGRVQVPDHAAFDFGTGPYAIEMWFNPVNAAIRGDLFTYKGAAGDFGIHVASQAPTP